MRADGDNFWGSCVMNATDFLGAGKKNVRLSVIYTQKSNATSGFRCLELNKSLKGNVIKLALGNQISSRQTRKITIIQFPMHTRRTNLTFQ